MKLPDDSQRIVITGRTGSGKTLEALHHLSQRSIDTKPWICLDFKGADYLSQLPVSSPATLEEQPPNEPGLYVVKAEIEEVKGGPVEDYLMAIFQQGNTGVLIDEGGMVGQSNRALRLLLTQGRSKNCPLIICSQRPVFIDKYCFSESEFLQFFYLQMRDDQDRVHEYVGEDRLDFDSIRALGKYHSIYYDVIEDEMTVCEPCPMFPEIYDRILTRLPKVIEDDPTMPARRVRV